MFEDDPDVICMQKWRMNEKLDCDNKILIIAQEKYFAIYEISELLNILGVKQKNTVKMKC